MIDEGLLAARKVTCRTCAYNRMSYGWKMGHCTHGGHDVARGGMNVADGVPYMEGPEANCPAGYWRDLKLVDLDAARERQRQALVGMQRQTLRPALVAAFQGRPAKEIQDRLYAMVLDKLIESETAAEVALEVQRRITESV